MSANPYSEVTPDVTGIEVVEELVVESFVPINLHPVLQGNYAKPEPLILTRDDGQALFYVGQVNGIHGPSGEGKTFITYAAIVEELQRGHRVVVIDLEDTAPSFVSRMRLLGAKDNQIEAGVTYIRPNQEFGPLATQQLCELIEEIDPRLVVIDSLGEAFGLDGIDENSDADVGPWLRRVARRIADLGPAVLLVDHSTKTNDNPLFASGSKRKRAAIGGASYLITATKGLVAGSGGRIKITCAKDRHGTYRRGEHVADWVMKVDDYAIAHCALYIPFDDGAGDAMELPIFLAARDAVRVCQEAGEPLSMNRIVERMTIKVKATSKRAGIEEAAARECLIESLGERRARLFAFVREMPDEALS